MSGTMTSCIAAASGQTVPSGRIDGRRDPHGMPVAGVETPTAGPVTPMSVGHTNS